MNIFIKIIVLFALMISCKNKEIEIVDSPQTTLEDIIKEEKKGDEQKDEDLLMEEQNNTILYKKNGIEGIIFTKKYYKNNPNNFTPTKQQIDEMEELISQEPDDFSNYYRQYDGAQFPKDKIYRIHVQLIPKDWVGKGNLKEWRIHRIAITNLNIFYDLNTKELSVPKLRGINH
ncbi:MAG: hypothetical protein WCY25_02510 [Moheibacter sp.]